MNRDEQAFGCYFSGYNKLPALLLFVMGSFSGLAQYNFQTCSDKFEAGHYDSALTCFNQLIHLGTPSKENYYNLGLCYYELKQYPEAIRDFDTCLVIDSNFKDASWMLGATYQQSRDWKKALTIYEMLNTKYSGYNGSKKRVVYCRLSVLLSENWYYMLAIMFMVIILVTVIAKTITYKRG